jgi:uncharacterized protein YrrD
MTSGEHIREGAKVIDKERKTLGTVGTIQRDPVSGEVETFTVKQGLWFMAKTKIMSVNLVKQVNQDPDTVVVTVSKAEFRTMPELETVAENLA